MAYFRLVEMINFKKNCSKQTFPSDFVNNFLGSEILYLFLAEEWSFVCFVANLLCLILAYFFN